MSRREAGRCIVAAAVRQRCGGERTGHTLGTTALVHEAYLELSQLEQIRWPGRAYVLASAGRAMRRILH